MRDPVKDLVPSLRNAGFSFASESAVPTAKGEPAWGEPVVSTGLKDDSGKAPWSLLMRGCALALAGAVTVLKFGSEKYAADSWQNVENAEIRYKDAMYRHLNKIELNGFMARDAETGLLEWYHVACNALFLAHFAAKRDQQEHA